MHGVALQSVTLSAALTLNRCHSDHMALLLLGALLGAVSYTATSLPQVTKALIFIASRGPCYILTAALLVHRSVLSNNVLGSRNYTVFDMTSIKTISQSLRTKQ